MMEMWPLCWPAYTRDTRSKAELDKFKNNERSDTWTGAHCQTKNCPVGHRKISQSQHPLNNMENTNGNENTNNSIFPSGNMLVHHTASVVSNTLFTLDNYKLSEGQGQVRLFWWQGFVGSGRKEKTALVKGEMYRAVAKLVRQTPEDIQWPADPLSPFKKTTTTTNVLSLDLRLRIIDFKSHCNLLSK